VFSGANLAWQVRVLDSSCQNVKIADIHTVIVLEVFIHPVKPEAGFCLFTPSKLALVPGMMVSHMVLLIKYIHGLTAVIIGARDPLMSTRMSDKFVSSRESNSLVDAGDDWAEERELLGVFGVDMAFEVRFSRKRLGDFATSMSAPVTSDKMVLRCFLYAAKVPKSLLDCCVRQ
jgi:hypothetical protein